MPIFNQVNANVYVLSTLAEAGLQSYWAGYFSVTGDIGSSVSTSEVWQHQQGFYLFLDQEPTDWANFTNQLNNLYPRLANTLRFLWISKTNAPGWQWILTTGFATLSSGNWTLTRSFSFNQDTYNLTISGQASLGYIPDADGGGITFKGGGGFTGPEGGYPIDTAFISFTGTRLGTFQSIISAPIPSSSSLNDVWTSLRIGFQYAGAPNDPEEENEIRILFMPLFQRQQMAMTLGLSFDPLNPFIAGRTLLDLFPTGTSSVPAIAAWLRTTKGYAISLTPRASSGLVPNARFVLGYSPVQDDPLAPGQRCHFSPDGAFQLSVQSNGNNTVATVPNQLLLGISGPEYATIDTGSYQLYFQANQPAFIPAVQSGRNISQALTTQATTSHLNVLAMGDGNAPVYYAQPREALIFSGKEGNVDGKLDFNPMPAFTLTAPENDLPPVFPAGVYAGISGEDVALAYAFENATLAPYRSYIIGASYTPLSMKAVEPERRLRDNSDPLGVTPQGLIAELSDDYNRFDGLILANMPNTRYPGVDLTAVTGMFKQVLQSNQLFFVARNPDILMTGTSVRYQLTNDDKPLLLNMGVPQPVIDAVYQTLSGVTQPFDTEGLFKACIATAAGDWLPAFLKTGGLLMVEMEGWTFQLSPRTWRTDPESPTLMIAKFCERSLLELAQDSSCWNWPQVAISEGGSLNATRTVLLKLLEEAGEPDATPSLRVFYKTVVTDKSWNGFLFLNAPVDIAGLPPELNFLTAGIDLTKFFAHHIGFSQTPFTVEEGIPQLQQTAAFGLIDYEDTLDLYAEKTIPLGFKTTRLQVRFANAALSEFSAEVQLMLNQLLAATLSKQGLERGNNLVMTGAYQRSGGVPGYTFTLSGQNVFNCYNTALASIEVLSVQLNSGGRSAADEVLTIFTLTGNLRFYTNETFDLFSYGPITGATDGYLRFSGLRILMRFTQSTPGIQTFVVNSENISFDLPNSALRPASLINNFPLKVSGLLSGPNLSASGELPSGLTPEDLGFTSVAAPMEQTPMKPAWYGLVCDLELGSFGALSGGNPFRINVLMAWSEGTSEDAPPVYLGLKLPGISAIAGSFPLQGVLKLGFRSFRFEVYTNTDNETAYLLRLKQFALSVLTWSFPPGNTDIVLFGETGNPAGSLGWYAAYKKDDDKKKVLKSDYDRRLQSGRRKPPVG